MAGGTTQEVTLKLNKDLEPGDYSARLRINYNDGESKAFDVTTTIRAATADEGFVPITPLSLAQSGSATFPISNSGPSTSVLAWTITTEQNTRDGNPTGEWLNIDPISASTRGGESTIITLTLKPAGTAQPGFYRSVLCVVYNGGKPCFAITAQLGGGQEPADFELTYDNVNYPIPPVPTNITIQGAPVFITRTGNFSGSVTLDVMEAPTDVQVISFNPNPLTTANTYSALNIAVGSNAPTGNHVIKIRGTSGNLEKTVEIPIEIQGASVPANFSLSLDPTSVSVNAGSSTTTKVIVNRVGGFNDIVKFRSGNKPNGVAVSFSPTQHREQSTATITVDQNAVPGQYAIRIIGSGGGRTKRINLSLNIVANDSENGTIRGNLTTQNLLTDFTVPILSTTSTSSTSLGALQITPRYEDESEFVQGQLLVKYHDDEARELTIQSKPGLKTLREGSDLLPDVISVSDGDLQPLNDKALLDLAEEISALPDVEYAEPNYIVRPLSLPNDAQLRQQWHVPATGLPVAWDVQNTSSKIIAVIDSGIDIDHPDLQGVFYPGRDFCGSRSASNVCQEDTDPRPDFIGDDHGTHVTGIITAAGNNGQGIAGVVYRGGKRVVPIKVFHNGNFTTVEALSRAILWAADLSNVNNPNKADIINMSLGSSQNSATLKNAIDNVINQGVLVIAAAGNFGQSTLLYPARYDQVLSVGSINSKLEPSCFSHFEAGKLDIVAFGGDYDISQVVSGVTCPTGTTSEAVLSTLPSNNYGLKFGTSQATPIVTGVAALVWSQNTGLSVNQVINRLKNTAYKGSPVSGDRYGAGILRADRALQIPGPGDDVTVTATGAATGDSGNATVTLNFQGTSNNFNINGLKGDNYTVSVSAEGKLVGSTIVQLGAGQTKTGVIILLQTP